jgi:glycosyltransferase involved in cell wall biosynthesis
MRVAHVITRLIVGGAQENTLASVLGLRLKPGLEVTLLSGPSTGSEGSLEPQAAAVPGLLTVLPDLVRPVHPWKDLLAWQKLTRHFRATQPDLVHTHSGKAGVLGRLAASRAGVPLIVHTIHGPSFGPFQGSLANAIFTAAERRAGRVTTHFVVVADAMTRQYLAADIGRPDRYIRVFSGFDLAPFLAARNDPAVRARWGLAPDDFVVGKIARLCERKGHDDLFAVAPELIRTHPRMKFLLVGDGPWRGRFEQRVRAAGLERHFVFTGLVPPMQIPELVGVMDALVHLSRRKGLPRSVAQALAAARPVIAFDCDGAGEVCRDGETGFLLAPGDLPGLHARLVQLATEPETRARLGRRGQDFVRAHFSVEQMVDNLHALYLRLAAARGMVSPMHN